jgi:cytochrome c551/c552
LIIIDKQPKGKNMANVACITTHRIQKDLMGPLSFEEVAVKYHLTNDALMDILVALFVRLGEQGKLLPVSYDSELSNYDWEE